MQSLAGTQAIRRVARAEHPGFNHRVGDLRRLVPGKGLGEGDLVTPAGLLMEALRARVQAKEMRLNKP